MTVTYFDSSALVKLLIEEHGSETANARWDASDAVVSSRLAHVEVRAALAASHRNQALATDGLAEAERSWADMWTSVRKIELTADVERQAGELAGRHALSGADAVHLASALAVGPTITVAVWDRRLHAACRDAGLAVAPATL